MKRGHLFCCRGVMILAMLGVFMTGCSFKVVKPVLEDEVFPALPIFIMDNKVVLKESPDGKIEIGPTSPGPICGFDDLEAFQETLLAEAQEYISGVPVGLLDKIRITGISLEKMEFAASAGDFTSLSCIAMEIQSADTGAHVFIAKNTGEFGATVELVADPHFDLVKASSGGCFEPFFTMSGELPEQDIVFDLIMHLKVKYRLALF